MKLSRETLIKFQRERSLTLCTRGDSSGESPVIDERERICFFVHKRNSLSGKGSVENEMNN